MGDEDAEDDLFKQQMAEIKRMQAGVESAAAMQKQLGELQGSLSTIISQPRVVDLTKKRREVGLRYKAMKRSLEVQAQNNSEEQPALEEKKDLGKALGMIRIPNSSLKSLGFDRDHKVLLPAQAFGRLQSSFMF